MALKSGEEGAEKEEETKNERGGASQDRPDAATSERPSPAAGCEVWAT